MLYLENGEVKITEDGMAMFETQQLYKKDRRNASKPYFKKCITYVYWAHNPDGEFRNMSPSRRKQKAAELAEVEVNDMEMDVVLLAFVKMYIGNMLTTSQYMLEGVKIRIDETLEWLRTIPMFIEGEREVEVVYINPLVKDGECNATERKIIKVPYKFDNSNEVKKALAMANLLQDEFEKLQLKILKEKVQKKKKRRRFES